MKERLKFVLEWEAALGGQRRSGQRSELCRAFGVSRDTGHRLIRQFVAGDRKPDAVREKSRRPHVTPTKVETRTSRRSSWLHERRIRRGVRRNSGRGSLTAIRRCRCRRRVRWPLSANMVRDTFHL